MDLNERDLKLFLLCFLHRKTSIAFLRLRGITAGQPPLLEELRQSDGCTQSELSRRCHLEPATITSTISTMERDGLVKRQADPSDRRVWRIFLTERGVQAYNQVVDARRDVTDIFFDGFSEEESALAQSFIARMCDNMDRYYASEHIDDSASSAEALKD